MRHFAADWGKEGDFGVAAVEPDSGEPVGAVWKRLHDEEAGEGYGCAYPELGIAIVPEFRGRGVGSLIMGEFVDGLRGRVDGLRLGVHPENKHAIRLYEKFGFEQYAIGAGDYPQMKLDF